MRSTLDVRFRNLIGPLREQGIWDFAYDIFISVMLTREDVFMINTSRLVGIDGLDGASVTRGILEGRRESHRLVEIMRAHFPGFQNARLRAVAPALGIRETRRILGEHTLTVEELLAQTPFPDVIAYSVYTWDLPDPKRPSHQPFEGKPKPLHTPIPYRCMLPRGMDNLIAAGRCISVERPVLGPVRVMAPCIAMGEAAGCATALALKGSTAYRAVDPATLRGVLSRRGGMMEATL